MFFLEIQRLPSEFYLSFKANCKLEEKKKKSSVHRHGKFVHTADMQWMRWKTSCLNCIPQILSYLLRQWHLYWNRNDFSQQTTIESHPEHTRVAVRVHQGHLVDTPKTLLKYRQTNGKWLAFFFLMENYILFYLYITLSINYMLHYLYSRWNTSKLTTEFPLGFRLNSQVLQSRQFKR